MSRRRSRSRDRHRRRRSRSPDRRANENRSKEAAAERYRSSRRDDRAPSRTPSPTPRWQRKRMRTYWDLTPEEAQQLGLAGGGFRGPRDPNALDDRQQHRILKSAKRLYIGNVPFGVMEMDLENFINMKMEEKGLINGHGGNSPVCERVHCDPNKQFAFATFRSVEECTNALDLHGSLFAGTELRFQRPRDYIVPIFDPLTGEVTGGEQPPPEMMTSTSGGGGGDRVRPPPVVPDGPNKIFLGGLPGTFSFEQVRELVAAFGQLKHFHLVTDRITGESKGYGFMEYEDPNITEVAITGLNGLEIGGRTLTCQHSSVEGERGAGPGDDARIPGDFKTVLPNQAVLNEEAVPTRILVLMNLMTEEGLAHDANYEDMLNSVRYECEQNGTVLSIHAPRPAMDADGKPAAQQSSGVGKVYVEFRMPQEAEATSTALAGRKFDERFVIMAFYSEALFAQQILQ